MTYRQLFKALNEALTDEQLDQDITVFDCMETEYHPAHMFARASNDGVLDSGHFVLFIK